ncbi:MAG: GDSL-type esterase/lipase family protein [Desulfitobacteriaceae bacterium]|nr:GDSL-type esterase/lipase family protein [Desulfitobacteriaceae bacterium]
MTQKIVCIGDSITYGYPFGPEHSWVNLALKNKTGMPTVINKGINGDTARGVKNRFERDVINCSPDIVIITVGTNDAWLETEAEYYMRMINACYSQANDAGIRTIIGIPVPALDEYIEEYLQVYRELLREFCQDHRLQVLDFYSRVNALSHREIVEFYTDEVHPSYAGYQLMAEIFSDFLNELT